MDTYSLVLNVTIDHWAALAIVVGLLVIAALEVLLVVLQIGLLRLKRK